MTYNARQVLQKDKNIDLFFLTVTITVSNITLVFILSFSAF